jgi:hypothetical protein
LDIVVPIAKFVTRDYFAFVGHKPLLTNHINTPHHSRHFLHTLCPNTQQNGSDMSDMYVYIHAYIPTCMCVHMCAYMHILYMYVKLTYENISPEDIICMYVFMHICMYVFMHICTLNPKPLNP